MDRWMHPCAAHGCLDQRCDTDLVRIRGEIESLKAQAIQLEMQVYTIQARAAEARRHSTMAYQFNSRLGDPGLPIEYLVVCRDGFINEPPAQLFPINAAEFYTLRNPTTNRQAAMLRGLAEFYDVCDPMDHDLLADNPHLVVAELATVLGLNHLEPSGY